MGVAIEYQNVALAGVSFRQSAVAKVRTGDTLYLVNDPLGATMGLVNQDNRAHPDPKAVAVLRYEASAMKWEHVGYLPAKDGFAARFYDALAANPNVRYTAQVRACVGGTPEFPTLGLRVDLPPV